MKVILVALSILLSYSYAHSQGRNDLKGPKSKNYKAWKNEREASSIVSASSMEKQKFPIDKNRGSLYDSEKKTEPVVLTSERKKSSGLKPKNRNPWRRN